jgi:hypothetical protein
MAAGKGFGRRVTSVVLSCILAVMLAACDREAEPVAGGARIDTKWFFSHPNRVEGSWAIYWYLCGSDLESEFGCASYDLEEMLEVDLPDNVNVIIQTGGSNAWHGIFDASVRQLYRYSSDGLQLLGDLPKANMGARSTLEDFLTFCNANYPADHRMLLFWDHGGGSLGGVCYDEQYGMDALRLPELAQVLAATSQTADGSPIYDVVGFDACLMASIDTAAVFYGYARYMVASQEIEPGSGWDYVGMFGALAANPGIDGDGLGRAICDSYFESMGSYNEPLATLSLIDLQNLAPLMEAYHRLGDESLVYGSQDQLYLGSYSRNAWVAENFYNSDSSGYSNMMDLGSMVRSGQQEGLFPIYGDALLEALDAVVLYQVTGTGHLRACGLSCFYNYEGSLKQAKQLPQLQRQHRHQLLLYVFAARRAIRRCGRLRQASQRRYDRPGGDSRSDRRLIARGAGGTPIGQGS